MRPCTTDSPATWPTTRPFDQPMALSVPNSRVRRETPEIVNSTASASATASTMSDSQVPRFVISDDALESEPETVEARSDCELTVASGSSSWRAACTRRDRVGGLRLHVDRRDDVAGAGELLRDVQRDVDVRRRVGLVRGRRRRCRRPRTAWPPTSMRVADRELGGRGVGRIEHGDVLRRRRRRRAPGRR